MTDRFLRDYRLTIGIGSQAVTILPPFRIRFSVDKSDKADLNKATIKIDGLNPDKRRRLVRDADEKPKKEKKNGETVAAPVPTSNSNSGYFPVLLEIGYQGKLETIFRGSIDEAGSTRENDGQFITTISAMDGGEDFLRGFVATTVTSKAAAVDAALGTMPNTRKGKIGAMGDITRPKVLVGNSMAVVSEMLDPDQRWFIDDERLNILGGTEVVSSFIPVVSAETGLQNTPEADKKEVTVTTWLNPSLKVGGLYQLISDTAPHRNGIYKISLITYSGDYDGSDNFQRVTGTIAENYVVPR
jgi:hypothetical protein